MYRLLLPLFAIVALLLSPGVRAEPSSTSGASASGAGESEGPPSTVIHTAKLIYGGDKSSVCFSEQFLADFKEQTGLEVAPTLTAVRADSSELFSYPFVVMTGEGEFSLPEAERENLRRYIDQGGFLVASAGCSSRAWDNSFQEAFLQLYPERELEVLPRSHAVFSTIYQVRALKGKRANSNPQLRALMLNGRVAMIYSAHGLNDTANVGDKKCCCCGGSELLNAKPMNVNLLAYALTH